MDIKIDRKSRVPIYMQVKKQIVDEIKNENLKIGEKLPTERELAQKLKISRNTISNTYNLLEQEGVLVSYQGRGTFVSEEEKTWKHQTIKDKILKIIDLALDQALEIGLNTEEFLMLVQERVKEKEAIIKNANVLFIECNTEQARVFAEELSSITKLNLIPLTISEVINMSEKVKEIIDKHGIIITPFSHVNEVKDLIDDNEKEIFGVAVNPSLKTIVKIAKYPKETKYGLISLSNKFCLQVDYALKSAGLKEINIKNLTSTNKKDLLDFIEASDVILVSPGRDDEIKKLVGDKKDIIRFDYTLDQNSVKVVMTKIIEVMEEKY
ncbi:MAG: GntR family transcriptional regulator [Marinisporobacter sp.]|jgi:DNA-binding transcriptional regulator YhcF (GntR family)|nr:GntR family transcriptional regulator [Marinisporobacter sp.]